MAKLDKRNETKRDETLQLEWYSETIKQINQFKEI